MPDTAEIARVRLSHVMDVTETQRTDALRTVTAETERLRMALVALAAGDGHVTQEFVERAITALARTQAALAAPAVCPNCTYCTA